MLLLDPPSPPPPLCEASYSGSTASTSVFNNFDSRQYLAYMDDDDGDNDGDEEEGHQQTRTTHQDTKKPNEKLQRRRQHNNNIGSSRIRGMAEALRQPAFIFGTPLLLSPLLFTDQKEHKCAFCVALMAVYWAGEVMPLAVTALLPLVLFPTTGIMAAKVVAREFLNDTNFLFIGSLVMATAVQRCGLHERVALAVLSLVGSEPRLICLSFMAITATLSMFISNTATTAMMLPICQMICTLLSRPAASAHHNPKSSADSANGLLDSGSNISCQKQQNRPPPAPNQQRMTKGLILSICFAANIGGVGTLTGTPPNLVLVGMLATLYPGVDTSINFLSWMALTVPLMVACLLLCWLSLCLLFFQNIPPSDPQVNILLRKKNAELPPMSFAQKSVALCFLLLLLLWVGRSPGFMPGLGHFFPGDFYTDATSAMAIAILLFLLPAENPLNWRKADKESAIPKQQQRLMDWPTMQQHFPWSVILLLGGGFALAAGVKESGLSELMARALSLLEQQPIWALQLICIVVTMMVTNICSNTVTASIFIPIVSSMAQRSSIHPLALMLPTTLACSFAFLLPVGTPSNAIVFSSGMLQVRDMIFSGLLVSSVVALTMIIYLANFVPLLMQIDSFPEWARLDTNETEIVESLLINIPQFEPVF